MLYNPILCVNQFRMQNLLYRISNIVHFLYPFKRFIGFSCSVTPCLSAHSFTIRKDIILCLFIYFGKVSVRFQNKSKLL